MGIKLEWAQFSDFDHFNVYRSLSPIDINNPPALIATNLKTMYYFDNSVIENQAYYYRVGYVKNGVEKISEVVKIVASKDEYFDSVDLLIFADADTFPSIIFKDSSKLDRKVTAHDGVKIVSPTVFPAKLDAGNFYFDGESDKLSSPISVLNTLDFTYETFCAVSGTTSTNARLFEIGLHTLSNGVLALCRDESTNNLALYIVTSNEWVKIITSSAGLSSSNKHVCLQRVSGIFYLYIEGVLVGSSASYKTYSVLGDSIFIGLTSLPGSRDAFNGYMSSIRLTKNVARYATTGFTPPTVKFQIS